MSEHVRPLDRVIRWMAATVVALLVLPAVGCWVLREWDQAQRKWRYQEARGRLRNVGLAVHQYATRYEGWTPPGGTVEEASPEWSWQVQLLPFLDRDDLYHRVDIHQPWDSASNRGVAGTSIASFLSPYEPKPDRSLSLAITHQSANAKIFGPRQGVSFEDIIRQDGTNSTIMLGEIGAEFPPWARPGNVRDPARGLRGGPGEFGRSSGQGGWMIFMAGYARFLPAETSPRVLELLADPNNGVPPGSEF